MAQCKVFSVTHECSSGACLGPANRGSCLTSSPLLLGTDSTVILKVTLKHLMYVGQGRVYHLFGGPCRTGRMALCCLLQPLPISTLPPYGHYPINWLTGLRMIPPTNPKSKDILAVDTPTLCQLTHSFIKMCVQCYTPVLCQSKPLFHCDAPVRLLWCDATGQSVMVAMVIVCVTEGKKLSEGTDTGQYRIPHP